MRLTTMIIVILAYQAKFGYCNSLSFLDIRTKSVEEALDDWKYMEHTIRSLSDQVIKQAVPYVIRANSEMDISPECTGSLLKLISGIRDFKEWAIRMLDATGKPGGGELKSPVSALGSYDECIDISLEEANNYVTKGALKGMYCLLDIRPSLPPIPKLIIGTRLLPTFRNYTSTFEVVEKVKKYVGLAYFWGYKIGVCLPSYCSKKDVQEIAKTVSRSFRLNTKVISCEVKRDVVINREQWMIIGIMAVFVTLVLSATIVEWFQFPWELKNQGLFHNLVKSFSLLSNLQDLLRTSRKGSDMDQLSCLDGIRFFSMTWVVLGHTYFFRDFINIKEAENLYHDILRFWFQAIANATLSVDTFFFITAVILSFTVIKNMKGKSLSAPEALIMVPKRILRLLPSVLLVFGIVFILPLVSSGPNWSGYADEQVNNCKKNWWKLLLFVNNFFDPVEQCISFTWYVSADVQLILFAAIFFYIYFRNPFMAKVALGLLTLISIIVSTTVLWYMELIPTPILLVYDLRMQKKYFIYFYMLPYSHFAVYALGIVLGIILASNRKLTLSLRVRVFGWSFAVLGNVFALYAVWIWNNDYMEPVGIIPSLYGGLHRPLWALGLAWLVLMCSKGYAVHLNNFLSWKVYGPLNKLTYLVYLLHVLVIVVLEKSATGPDSSSQKTVVRNFLGYLCLSFGFAFILKLFYESPVLNIQRLMLEKRLVTVFTKQNINSSSLKENQSELGTCSTSSFSVSTSDNCRL